MHGREGEERKRWWHMWPVPASSTAPPPPQLPAVTVTPTSTTSESPSESDSSQPSCDFLLKDGRKIQVGDCALFQTGNAPPFIGLIRCIRSNKEEHLKLSVNWLYRPADIKLAKGILLEASPNEVFYSFHQDDIPAVSLLHPCKVAFLHKGIELPVGISSFVCRRVYDIANKCLWWLADKDYINERQEEVDKLLDKTWQEMHAAVQSGGRSPKPLNGSANAQQLKSASEGVQNNANSFTSQSKKKRERTDQGTEPIKRERSAKSEDGDSVNLKLESMTKEEIAKITEKGGLISTEGVEKLVNLMHLDRNERKMDFAGRILVAEVIAATDRYDCLGRFVQLKGVAIFDDWLQEAHKGKSGDGSSPRECDKTVEDLLLSLLRALDKLPVNLNALQACNIGKSVNHLRSHKNLEIQKKARSLIDTWKKRVDAEMTKINDAKSVGSSQPATWPAKSGFSDATLGGNRRPGTGEVTAKSPVHQPATIKSMPGKTGHSDTSAKSAHVASGTVKASLNLPTSVSVSSNSKLVANSGGSEMPPTTVKEEKSSSSSQSQNNSQTCSDDHIKGRGSSRKEDTRSSTSGSVTKATGGSSRHRRSSNGLTMGVSGSQKDNNLIKSSSISRPMASEKASQSGLTCEKQVDMSTTDQGNSHVLIVRLPARNASGASDPSVVGSRTSSPGVSDKHEHGDRHMKLTNDTCQPHLSGDAIAESWQKSVDKDVAAAEGTRSPMATLDEDSRNAEEIVTDATRTSCSTSGNEKGVIDTEPRNRNSFSSINALIESCAKYSETSTPLAAGDDMGMNLLASVAAGEMSKSESLTGSAGTSAPIDDPSTGNNEAKSRLSCDDDVVQGNSTSDEAADADSEKATKDDPMDTKDDHQQGMGVLSCTKDSILVQDTKLIGEQIINSPISSPNLEKTANSFTKTEVKHEEDRADGYSSCKQLQVDGERESSGTSLLEVKRVDAAQVLDHNADSKMKEQNVSLDGSKLIECACEKIEGNICTSDTGNKDLDVAASGKKNKESPSRSPSGSTSKEEGAGVLTPTLKLEPVPAEVTERTVDALHSGDHGIQNPKDVGGSRSCNSSLGDGPTIFNKKHDVLPSPAPNETIRGPVSVRTAGVVEDLQIKEAGESCSTGPAEESSTEENALHAKTTTSRISEAVTEEQPVPSAKATALPLVTGEPDIATRFDFDLNEGITVDDGIQVEPAILVPTVCTSAIHLPGISFVNPRLNGLPAPISVAPAKGPFFPPELLLKSKGEPGWKGSAATSAFRPAEPRKVLEMPLSTPDIPPSDSSGKHGRLPLDIDLNITDEREINDLTSQCSGQTGESGSGLIGNHDAPSRPAGGIDLDLNRVDENPDNGQFLGSTSHRIEVPFLPKKSVSGGTSNGETNVFRDFDLNNGPSIDEVTTEPVQKNHNSKGNSSVPSVPPASGLRMNNTDLGNVSSWFPMGNSYPAVAIQSFLPDRAEHQSYPIVAGPGAQRILGASSGGGTFASDMYRGPVLSSSPAMAFSPATAFPYTGFPFGSTFPLASTFSGGSTPYSDSSSVSGSNFLPIPSQLVGPAGAVPSHYHRPYFVSTPEGSTSVGSDNSRRWSRQGLDLNAGLTTTEGNDERLPAASRSLSVATSQNFMEEQTRAYALHSGSLKRKEPEGGWDADRSAYKQSSWQ